ncbi:GlcG/HbpS family heme-binding protein [Rhodopila globiformis]|uniref:GlcG protein n=1 Tax=Rhodopila globiformis TaxID=1071 RepID=A0A2S6NPE1_RHOGL|nr:heme-binding protein [Rhodopila globiformis]PPQ40839.1 GlcG protein [Rhodopila globiformis]
MAHLTLADAQAVIAAALAHAREKSLAPMAVAVLDARGALKAFAAEEGTALRRADIAIGKAYGALAMGVGSRTLGKRAEERPHFIASVTQAIGGSMVPVAGGVLIRDDDKNILGAVGATGDTSDNDEAAALAGLSAAGLTADPS